MLMVVPDRLQAEQRLHRRLIHPSGRAGVPGPAAAADVHRVRVDVGGHDVGLGLVALDAFGVARVVDRVDQVEQLHRLVAHAEPGQRDHHPQRRVRVLAAVLPDARQVALDVAGIARHPVEGRRQQQHELRVAAHQMRAHGVQRALDPARLRRARTAPPTTASASRACTPRSAPSPAASRRRSRRADTSRRPRPARASR